MRAIFALALGSALAFSRAGDAQVSFTIENKLSRGPHDGEFYLKCRSVIEQRNPYNPLPNIVHVNHDILFNPRTKTTTTSKIADWGMGREDIPSIVDTEREETRYRDGNWFITVDRPLRLTGRLTEFFGSAGRVVPTRATLDGRCWRVR